jgi:6-phosphofructokinase 1
MRVPRTIACIAPHTVTIAAHKQQAGTKGDKKQAKAALAALEAQPAGRTLRLARQLEELTGLESRVTILGYLQRGGRPRRPIGCWRHS